MAFTDCTGGGDAAQPGGDAEMNPPGTPCAGARRRERSLREGFLSSMPGGQSYLSRATIGLDRCACLRGAASTRGDSPGTCGARDPAHAENGIRVSAGTACPHVVTRPQYTSDSAALPPAQLPTNAKAALVGVTKACPRKVTGRPVLVSRKQLNNAYGISAMDISVKAQIRKARY